MTRGLGFTSEQWIGLAPAEKTAALKRAGIKLVKPVFYPQPAPIAPAPVSTLLFCHCSHVQGGHLAGSGRCMVITGDQQCGCEHFVEESHCLGDCGAELNDINGDENGYCRHCARLLRATTPAYEADARD